MSVLSMEHAHAADDAEVEALKKEIAALRQQLDAAKSGATPVPTAAPASAAQAAPAAAAASTPAAAAAAEPTPATASLGTVVVTSRKPLLAVIDVPQSVSVVSGDELKRDDSASLEAITKRMSNVKWNYGNSSTSNYSIRGLGKIANNHAADPSVGLYVDGIAYAYNPLGSFDFYDVDTIAVSRGPQGFTFGKNTTVGGIQVKYKRPSFAPSTDLSVGFNGYEGQRYGQANGNVTATGSATGPLVDGLLAYRTSLRVNKGGGWLTNSYNPDNQYINSDRVSGRVQLLLTPSPDFDARLGIEVAPRMSENSNIGSTNFFFGPTPATYANGAPNTALSTEARLGRRWFTRNTDYTVAGSYYNPDHINSDSQQGVVSGSNGLWLEMNWALNDDHKLTSITAFKDYYFNAFRDDEGTVFDVQTAAGNRFIYNQYSQELRLSSKLGPSVDLQSGLFLLKSSNSMVSNGVFGTDGGAWYASNAQYNRLDPAASNSLSGRLLLNDSLADLWRATPQKADNQTIAAYASADWRVSEQLTLNTGARLSQDKRALSSSSLIVQQGYGADLSPGAFNVNGDFLLATNTAEQTAAADRVANRYFGLPYSALSLDQRRQVADARSIRQGRVGAQFDTFQANAVKGNHFTWSFSPRYKLDDNATAYFSVAHGEKAGVPGILATTGSPVSYKVKPEKSNAIEVGFKSNLLGGALLFNTALFVNDIKDYQQTLWVEDTAATALARTTDPLATTVYASGAGNVPKVRAKGLEVDLAYSGIRNFDFRVSGAYNDARYVKFDRAALPVERANEGSYYDASGKTLPGASKFSLNLGVAYQQPVFGDKVFHASVNTSYASRFNSDNNLSEYAWIEGSSTTDLSFGIGGAGGKWDVNTYVKNAFNDDTVRNRTWNAYAPGFPRQFGITFSTKL